MVLDKSKALSIRQPWAWLIVNGHKDIENRSWKTSFTGHLYIHAAKKFDSDGLAFVKKTFPHIALPQAYVAGGVVGSVIVTGFVTESENPWFTGKYGFVLKNPRRTPFYVVPGKLGLWDFGAPIELDMVLSNQCQICGHSAGIPGEVCIACLSFRVDYMLFDTQMLMEHTDQVEIKGGSMGFWCCPDCQQINADYEHVNTRCRNCYMPTTTMSMSKSGVLSLYTVDK